MASVGAATAPVALASPRAGPKSSTFGTRRMPEREENACLAMERLRGALALVGRSARRLHALDRDGDAEHEMRSGVDDAEAALAENALDAIFLGEGRADEAEEIARLHGYSS